MAMTKALSKAGRKPGDGPPPDQGCRYSPACATCPWRECVWTLPADERKIFTLAYRTLATFKAKSEEVIAG
jgi:hypothetical protein